MTVEHDEQQTGAVTPEADRIVAEVLAGDTQAFAEVVRLYQQDVWRIAAALLRDRDATENLVQQVFVDAYFHLDQYAQDGLRGVDSDRGAEPAAEGTPHRQPRGP